MSIQANPRVLFSTKNPFLVETTDDVPADAPEGAYTYAIVKSAPEVPAEECETSVASLEVQIRWGASVLALTHLTPPRSFFVGEELSKSEPVDCALPAEILGARRAPVVLADDNGFASLVILPGATGTIQLAGQRAMKLADALAAGMGRACDAAPGAQQIALPAGARGRIELGDVVVEIAAVNAGKVVAPKLDLGSQALPFHGISAMVHIGLLAAVAFFMPPMGDANAETATPDQQYLMQQYLQAAAERETTQSDANTADTATNDQEGGKGTAAKGESGTMGTETKKMGGKFAVEGPRDNKDVRISRAAMLDEASKFGAISILSEMNGSKAPTASWGDVDALGNDPISAKGNMWGQTLDDAYGAGALGLSGIGEGGSGRGEGIGLGALGTIGHGNGTGDGDGFGPGFGSSHGRLRQPHKPVGPQMRPGTTSVSGRIPAEVIQRIVRQNFGRFRSCYETALRGNPNLEGRVAVRFVIGRDGAVTSAQNGGSDLPDSAAVSCVVRSFFGLSFPQPDGGIVTVSYPIMFTPGQ